PAFGEIRGQNRLIPIIFKGRKRWAITSSLIAVTLPAFSVAKQFLPAGDAFRARGHFLGGRNGRRRWFLELIRESLEVRDDLQALPIGEHAPGRHRTPRQAIGDDAQQIVVGRGGAAGGGADFKDTTREVTRFGKDLSGRGAVSFALIAMALRTF